MQAFFLEFPEANCKGFNLLHNIPFEIDLYCSILSILLLLRLHPSNIIENLTSFIRINAIMLLLYCVNFVPFFYETVKHENTFRKY
jgi:hypothetical protein